MLEFCIPDGKGGCETWSSHRSFARVGGKCISGGIGRLQGNFLRLRQDIRLCWIEAWEIVCVMTNDSGVEGCWQRRNF